MVRASLLFLGAFLVAGAFAAEEDPYKEYIDSVGEVRGTAAMMRTRLNDVVKLRNQAKELAEAADKFETEQAAAKKLYDSRKSALDKAEAELKAKKATLAEYERGAAAVRNLPEKVRKAAEDSVAEAKTAADAAQRAVSEVRPAVDASQAALKKLDTAINTANKQIVDLNNSAARSNQSAEEARQLNEAAVAGQRGKIAAMEGKIKLLGVGARLSDIQSEITDVKVRAAAVEKVLNEGVVGDFVKAKMAGLLNNSGGAFCNAMANCSGGADKKPVDIDQLFKTTEGQRNKAAKKEDHDGEKK